MKTDPIRWVCGLCLKVVRRSLTAYENWSGHFPTFQREIRVYLPECCGREMLIAGEPKRDVHGLREKNAMIDPVDNLIGVAV